ncbi:MAG: cobalamin B12-binding domain-containing protein [Desulfomonile tiedjei]|uniref:Cobalamin B12-binding domain-containing protein n=1 Tax=Desulfomonile tiedjei TaxID=2358 RepID=A0A9D6Z0J8_9BACT|nr:cobalamin B12-binding domain-containing protein [Desulfomonile tiedjei]
MRVLLISANREEINMRAWPLGAASVAAATRESGHEVVLLDLMSADCPESAVREAVEGFRPDIIGVSIRNVDDQNMADPKFFLGGVKDIISGCKTLTSVPIVLGGAGYSIFPESLLEFLSADMGIQGEGESAFPALLERLENRENLSAVPGLYLPRTGPSGSRAFQKDLDRFPLPDSRFLPQYVSKGEEFWFPVQTRRGCPMSCSYCSTPTIEGYSLRKRSPEAVVRWLGDWVKLGVRRYYFVDNTFNLPRSYAKRLCSKIIAAHLDITWRCIIYPIGIDEELAGLMASAGCKDVALGFESSSELVLHGMKKRFRPENVRTVCEILRKYGMQRMGFLMLGGPGETKESALASLEFADSLKLDSMKVTLGIRIYPYTELAKTAVAEGLVKEDDDLLTPRFYMTTSLESWLRETVDCWMSTRPNWMK